MKRCEEIEKENGLFIVIDVSEITVIIVVVLPFLCCCRERERERAIAKGLKPGPRNERNAATFPST